MTTPDETAALQSAILDYFDSSAWLVVSQDDPAYCVGCGAEYLGSEDTTRHAADCPVAALWRACQRASE